MRNIVLRENLLQTRTESSTKRIVYEVVARLSLLTSQQLNLLAEGSVTEQQYLLWLSVCKNYTFIYEFAVEILREKILPYGSDVECRRVCLFL